MSEVPYSDMVLQAQMGLRTSGIHSRTSPRARRDANLLLEGAIERGLRLVANFGTSLCDANAGPFEQAPGQLQAPAS